MGNLEEEVFELLVLLLVRIVDDPAPQLFRLLSGSAFSVQRFFFFFFSTLKPRDA